MFKNICGPLLLYGNRKCVSEPALVLDDGIADAAGEGVVGVVGLWLDDGEVIDTDLEGTCPLAVLGQRLVSTMDGAGDDGDVEFLGENGEGLLEFAHFACLGACAFGEDDDVLALLEGFAHALDGGLEIGGLHDDDVVALGNALDDGVLDVRLLGKEEGLADVLLGTVGHDEHTIEERLMVGGEHIGAFLRDVLGSATFETEVETGDELEEPEDEQIVGPGIGELEVLGIFVEDVMPVYLLDLDARLVVGHVFGEFEDIAEGGDAFGRDVHAEGLLEEALQTYLVERIELQVGVEVVGRTHGALLLVLDVVLDDLVFGEGWLDDALLVLVGMFARRDEGGELEALELVHLGARQFAMIDEERHKALVGWHFLVVGFEEFTLEGFLEFLVVAPLNPRGLWNDDGLEHIDILDDADLLDDVGVLLELKLDFGGVDVLAVGEDDDLLGATGDVEAALVVETSEVARVEPAFVVEDGSRLLGTVVIALHHIGTLDADFAVLEDDLLGGEGFAHRAGDDVVGTRERDHGCALGHTVTFEQVETEGLDVDGNLAVEGCAARDEDVEMSAKCLAHGGEDEATEPTPLEGTTHFKYSARESLGFDLRLDASDEGSPQTGYANHQAYLAALEGVEDVGSGHSGRDGYTATDGDGSDETAQQGEHVVEWQEDDGAAILRIDAHFLRDRIDVGHHIAEREHYALRRARGAGGVNDNGSSRRLVVDLGGANIVGQFDLLVFVDDQNGQLASQQAQGFAGRVELLVGSPDAFGLTVAQGVGHLVGRGGGIDRDSDAAIEPDAEEGVDPAFAVFGEDDSLGTSVGRSVSGEIGDAAKHLLVTDVTVAGDDGGLVEVFDHNIIPLFG